MKKKATVKKKAKKTVHKPIARKTKRSGKATRSEALVTVAAAKGRPMLTWVGKRPLRQVIAFPSQLVERHDALNILGIDAHDIDTYDRRTRVFRSLREHWNAECWEDQPCLQSIPCPESGGLLLHGDNLECLATLLAYGYRGRVNLVYIDPPFDSGADYVREVNLRGAKGGAKVHGEVYSLGEQIQYTDIWANDNYLQFMYERLILLHELLSENGSILVHCDWRKAHHLRMLMDEVFGEKGFVNEIIWLAEGGGASGIRFGRKHQTLLYYTKAGEDGNRTFNGDAVRVPYKTENIGPQTYHFDANAKQRPGFKDGYTWTPNEAGKVPTDAWLDCFLARSEGVPLDVWYDVKGLYGPSGELENYPTQKPVALLERVIAACSSPGDIVLDCFVGSGTTVAVAQDLGRRWIGCDINKGAIQTTVKRLRGIVSTQISQALADKKEKAGRLPGISDTERLDGPPPCQFGFSVWRVNDYDLQIQHNEAVNIACQHIGVQHTKTDAFFDGTRGKELVKVVPFDHPLSPVDLDELRKELEARPDESRSITVVCLGMEFAARAWIDDWNRLRKGSEAVNRIDVIELRTDPKYGKFLIHEPATAKVKIARRKGRICVEIMDFISPTIVERLQQQAGLIAPKIDDWRAMVDCVMIDTNYNGSAFNVVLADIPEKKTDLVDGSYEVPAEKAESIVAVKMVDMLGEEVLVTKKV